jgi:very-short-patch-repair endonuclease
MEGCGRKRQHGGRFQPHPPLDLAIARLAAAQHGIVALLQLVMFGLSSSAVRNRVACGRLHRVHAGVYAVGHAPLTRNGHFIAAVFACGGDSTLSHREGAALRRLRPSSRVRVDVTSPTRRGRQRAGIDAHYSSTLAPQDITLVEGIRCTSVARTLLDLAAILPRHAVERALDQAAVLEVLDAREIEDVLHRTNGHRGNATLRSILDDHARGTTLTRNNLERAFLAICRQAGLPQPEVNAWIPLEPTGYEPDFLWREQRLIAETDGGTTHTTPHAFEHDRKRDQKLMLAGFRVVRFPWMQVFDEPEAVEATLHGLLGTSVYDLATRGIEI